MAAVRGLHPEFLPPLARSPRLAAQRRDVIQALYAQRQNFLDSLKVLGPPRIWIENNVDNAPCPELDFSFVARNEPITGVKLFDEDFLSGCDCQDCTIGSCSCIKDKFWHEDDPVYLAYDRKGRLLPRILEEKLTIYECNAKCGCAYSCPNKVVSRGRQVELEVFKTLDKGWGVRCPVEIQEGQFVSCYRGELVDSQTAEQRGAEYDILGRTYLFDLDLFADDLEAQNLPMLTIDAFKKGDISRFFNHSCDPNLRSIAVSHGIAQHYEIAFFATRKIRAREELCFDYDPTWTTKEAERSSRSKSQPIGVCACKSSICRGWVFHK